jgi:hypothetical protein
VRRLFVVGGLGAARAARGVPVLRFDYAGTWDSLGETTEADCARWQADIAAAHAELRARTGVGRVIGLGVRFGATLLVAAQVTQALSLARLVLWDPVLDGAEHYAELAALHRRYVRAMQHLRLGRAPRRYPDVEELLGCTYATRALRQLRDLRIEGLDATLPGGVLLTADPGVTAGEVARVVDASAHPLVRLPFDCGWRDIGQQEDIIPDAGISRALVELVRAA